MAPNNLRLKTQLLAAVKTAVSDIDSPSLCIALSGGLDSIVLLHICHLLNAAHDNALAVSAVHVNHGLSPHADMWQRFCAEQCEQRNIGFACTKVDLSKQAQQSLEAQARQARYSAIEQHLASRKEPNHTQTLLLAQHQNDQAETFFIQLLRGSGLRGLGSMPAKKQQASGSVYLRPLLSFSRAQLLEFATSENLIWVEDESNKDTQFDRNFLRHSILPKLQQKWPQLHKTVARSAQHCAQAQQVIDEYMLSLRASIIKDDRACVDALTKLSEHTQKAFLRYWLAPFCSDMPSQAQLQDVHGLLKKSKNTSPYVQLNTIFVERFQHELQIIELDEKNKQPIAFALSNTACLRINKYWHIRGTAQSSESLSIIKDSKDLAQTEFLLHLPADCRIEFGASNLRAKLFANRPTKSLKQVYQDLKISPLVRLQTPVIVSKNEVIGVLLPPNTNIKKYQLRSYLLLNDTWLKQQHQRIDLQAVVLTLNLH